MAIDDGRGLASIDLVNKNQVAAVDLKAAAIEFGCDSATLFGMHC
jgi:hypothetical protein